MQDHDGLDADEFCRDVHGWRVVSALLARTVAKARRISRSCLALVAPFSAPSRHVRLDLRVYRNASSADNHECREDNEEHQIKW